MDLDALLARLPEIALIDELAHTNAPGLRHAKGWQDVKELPAAGINVISTVNVQELMRGGSRLAANGAARARS